MISLRYAREGFNFRSEFIRLCSRLQGRSVAILKSNPAACTRILASSNTKGHGIELMVACPAWAPIYSIESVDGEEWEWLATHFSELYNKLGWETRISSLTRTHVARFAERTRSNANFVLDAEQISRLTANILFDLVFLRHMSPHEEDLFYCASVEWRKELAVKGKGCKAVKNEFWALLGELLEASPYADDMKQHQEKRNLFLSLFAQPLIISPQINFSDIMSAVFGFLRQDPALYAKVLEAAHSGNIEYLRNVCFESIRLKHPFPILERELTGDVEVEGTTIQSGTQVYIMVDDFDQDKTFDPERWQTGKKNPYRQMLFGSGRRMCRGKGLAQEILGEMLRGVLLETPDAKIKPSENHLFSGRDNDNKDSLTTIFYQIRIFAKLLWRSMRSGSQGRKGVCPFTGRSRRK